MSIVRMIADLHLGHEAIAKWRGFETSNEHDEHLIEKWNSVVKKRDITYILGDITNEKNKYYSLLDRLYGRKIAILGNHDLPKHSKQLLNHVDYIGGIMKYKGIFLSHCPVHSMELDYRISRNIHGHLHEKSIMIMNENGELIKDKRYHCVSVEQVDFKPVSLLDLRIKR
jgi:calcineurin-like phosphoesterase family protein